jgi:murein DD-endopeptidase
MKRFWTSLCGMLPAVLLGLALHGCSSNPPVSRDPGSRVDLSRLPQHPALQVAASMVGSPYRFGGSTPHGFDCSGLVFYAFRAAGIHVPRSTRSQYRYAFRVARNQLQPGDLVFFKLNRHEVSHVGIYAGNGQFIHAPSKGKQVSFTAMSDPYWHDRYVGAGRYF